MMNSNEILSSKKHLYYKIKLFTKIKILAFFVILLITCVFILFSMKKTVNVYYKEDSNINYLLYLKENDYYTTPYLTKGMQYIASLIDYIDIDFNYNFKMNEKMKYDYYYYIDANIKVFEKDNPTNVIYKKNIKLVDDKVVNDESNLYFTINENLKINYGEYNDLIKSFKTSYNVIADSELTLTLYVYFEGEHEYFDEPIKTNSSMNLVIPLTEQMINIDMDYKEINNSEIITKTTSKGTLNNMFFVISVIVGSLVLFLIIDLVILIVKMITGKTEYQKRVESILREYDRVIVDVTNSNLMTRENNIIKVMSFEELLDVSDRLEKPILHYEVSRDRKNLFMVRDENDIYYYYLTSENHNGEDYEKHLQV